jgi:3''-phosphoadenosine 5''-phosphosulfate sulfotransferase (PAPS reductase)/FAD synthetase and related enzymes
VRNHIIFFSGGKSSFAVADWVLSRHPEDNILLYFTDTKWENEDLYRFINESSDKLKLPLLTHSAGLNPVQLMFEKKLVFNSMIGDCSKILKMKVARDFLKKGIKPPIEQWRNKEYLKNEDFITDATLYFGIGFDEMHREDAIRKNWEPFKVEMPLIENNIWVDKVLEKWGIRQPKLYDYGFAHNNCNGRCVKAGQGHYKLLKEAMPDVFREILEQEHYLWMYVSSYRYLKETPADEQFPEWLKERELQELDDAYRDYFYGRADKPKIYIHPVNWLDHNREYKRYSFMKRDGQPYNIRDLHYEVENDGQIDLFDIGGCGCFVEGFDSCEIPKGA